MKKLIYIFILAVSIGKAQLAHINIKETSDTVIIGDTLTIRFTWTASGSDMAKIQLWTPTYLQDCMNVFWGDLSTMPVNGNGYTIYKVKITPAMGTGIARVYSNFTPNPGYKPFYIKASSGVGIKEYDPNSKIINIQYYDIYGKEKPSLMEGFNIRVSHYDNGFIRKEKVFIP
jgi:hypothetical protein